jgi:hypothetical protein
MESVVCKTTSSRPKARLNKRITLLSLIKFNAVIYRSFATGNLGALQCQFFSSNVLCASANLYSRNCCACSQKYNHAQMHKAISDQNLELLRERLIQTVKLTSDGDNIDRPPLRGME